MQYCFSCFFWRACLIIARLRWTARLVWDNTHTQTAGMNKSIETLLVVTREYHHTLILILNDCFWLSQPSFDSDERQLILGEGGEGGLGGSNAKNLGWIWFHNVAVCREPAGWKGMKKVGGVERLPGQMTSTGGSVESRTHGWDVSGTERPSYIWRNTTREQPKYILK